MMNRVYIELNVALSFFFLGDPPSYQRHWCVIHPLLIVTHDRIVTLDSAMHSALSVHQRPKRHLSSCYSYVHTRRNRSACTMKVSEIRESWTLHARKRAGYMGESWQRRTTVATFLWASKKAMTWALVPTLDCTGNIKKWALLNE